MNNKTEDVVFGELRGKDLDELCDKVSELFITIDPRYRKYWNKFNSELYCESGCMDQRLEQFDCNDGVKHPDGHRTYFSDGFWINNTWFNKFGHVENYITYFLCDQLKDGSWKIKRIYEDTIKSTNVLNYKTSLELAKHIIDRMVADGIPTYED